MPNLLAIGLALAAAVCLAGGFVIQQHAAAEEPPDERLSFRLLYKLVRRPVWLGGIGVMAAGQLLGAAALGHGTLALVEPVTALNLLFALPLSAIWNRIGLTWREWTGAVALIAGLIAFLAAGAPHGGSTAHLPWPNWVISGGTVVLAAGALVTVARRKRPDLQATLLAAGAGTLYGLQDALTQRVVDQFGHSILGALVAWPVFCLVAVAVVAMLLAQSAFEAAPLAASLPAITVAEPITGISFGVGVYDEHLNLGPVHLVVELLGLTAMVVGVFLVARSPIVTGAALHHEQAASGGRTKPGSPAAA